MTTTQSNSHVPAHVNTASPSMAHNSSSDAKVNGSVSKKEEKEIEPAVSQPLILNKGYNSMTTAKKKDKKKKKKQRHRESTLTNTVVKSDPISMSTTNIPDYSRSVWITVYLCITVECCK